MTPTHAKLGRRKRWLRVACLVALLLVLVGSLVCNVLLYRQASQSYRELHEVRLDPYGLGHRFAQPSSQPSGTSPIVVFLGDSRAEQWPAPNVSGFTFVNRGIDGQTTEQIRGRLDAQVLPLHPRIVVIQAGINDLKTTGLFPDRRDKIVANCEANLHAMVTACKSAGSAVIVTTIFPTGPVPLHRRSVWSPGIDGAVEEVNADIRGLASQGVVVLDAWKILEENGHLRRAYAADTLHLRPQAYEMLNSELVSRVDQIRGAQNRTVNER